VPNFSETPLARSVTREKSNFDRIVLLELRRLLQFNTEAATRQICNQALKRTGTAKRQADTGCCICSDPVRDTSLRSKHHSWNPDNEPLSARVIENIGREEIPGTRQIETQEHLPVVLLLESCGQEDDSVGADGLNRGSLYSQLLIQPATQFCSLAPETLENL
jgi:hypothetical protein